MSARLEQYTETPDWMIADSSQKNYELVGQSARLRQVLRLAAKLGKGHWPVLLLGETGTGKELVARTIHRNSPSGPFVTIDCSAMVGPLMESELFGHAKGAFTGAHAQKIGLIEQADGGTAFFDEIGELPLDLQSKLLRVLQEKEFRPVGSLQVRKSSFRIVAATNRDLAEEVQKGTFRQDLYYRLNVVTLRLAPLRERKDDLPSLIAHFLGNYGNGHQLTGELLELMMSYDWPGNVRELENCIQHMVAVNSGPLLHSADAPSNLLNFGQKRRFAASGASSVASNLAILPTHGSPSPSDSPESSFVMPVLPLSEMERRAIIQALQYTKGDRVMAAHLLGIGRTTLYRKLKEYGIQD
ncbi:sigma-54 dependent transcriptional regulator [uncultured Paludibaculum sp.]|uniref:sigma-54 interaction domain-containing protein n=1 Tax=uncultured Paludibaculum sp. TaxID=1765020 RepID=UPI002AAC434A|nr:sigma-54 dependent transcriptional regulator [uncultured Paludibaculum sp.]